MTGKESELEKQWEKLLRIKTSGRDDSVADEFKHPYEPTPYGVLMRIANSGYIRKNNLIIDYGCGKGRVGIYLSYETRCRSIGIEFDERIYKKATENREKCCAKSRVMIYNEKAEDYIVDKEADRFYFFNPFRVEILKRVMKNIIESYYDDPREMLLFFYYPDDEYITYLMSVEEITFYDEISCDDLFEENKERERVLIFSMGGQDNNEF